MLLNNKEYIKSLTNTPRGYIKIVNNICMTASKRDIKNMLRYPEEYLGKYTDIRMENRMPDKLDTLHKHVKRTEKDRKDLINRLKRIEGQVRGVQRMIEDDGYCPEIMVQVSAINSALNSFNKVLLAAHLKNCVVHDIQEGRPEVIDEFVETLQKVMK